MKNEFFSYKYSPFIYYFKFYIKKIVIYVTQGSIMLYKSSWDTVFVYIHIEAAIELETTPIITWLTDVLCLSKSKIFQFVR